MCLCVCGVGVCVKGGVLVFLSLSRTFGTLRKGRAREHVEAFSWYCFKMFLFHCGIFFSFSSTREEFKADSCRHF